MRCVAFDYISPKRLVTETKRSIVRAFLLALFAQIVTKLLCDFTLKLKGPEALMQIFEEKKAESKVDENHDEEPEEEEQRPVKKKRKDIRRRKIARGSDSDRTPNSDSDLSEAEYSTPEVTDSESEGRSDDSDVDSDVSDSEEDSDILDADFSEESDEDDDIVIESCTNIVSTLNVVKVVLNHFLSPPFRMCCRW